MERNTKTTLGELVPGDRFYFASDKNKQVHQVTERIGKTNAHNIVAEDGKRWYKHDLMTPGKKAIVFLRNVNI